MFLEHYGLIEQPFGVTPDPRFLHMGPKHREAVASLLYGTESNRGFLALIAQPGMGKTSLLFQYLEYLRSRTRTAYIFQTDCDSREFLRYLLTDLGVDTTGKDLAAMHEELNRILLEEMRAGRRFILVIDEAQNLRENVLESVRLLSNFETPWMKLMQIVIAGQPQLAECLARPSMAQLRQRISTVIRLEPFTAEETNAYINHRLWVAGYSGPDLFTVGARLSIAECSGGIPRNINTLCFNAMSIAYAMDAKKIDAKIVEEAATDLEIESLVPAIETPARASIRFRPLAHSNRTLQARKTGLTSRFVADALSAATVLCLAIVSGFTWNAGMRTPPLDVFPSAETASVVSDNAPESAAISLGAAEVTLSQPPGQITPASSARLGASIGTITVEKEETLRHVSFEYLNRSDELTLAEIRALNPEISDFDHIARGQQIRIPLHLRPRLGAQLGLQVSRIASSPAESAARTTPANSREVNR
jgi:general secretion pathway protein A